MDRREFVTSLAAAGLTINHQPSAINLALVRPIGLQLYTVRDAMQADFEGTIARVARTGYTEVEFAGYFNHTPAQVREILARNHLRSPSAHTDATALTQDFPRLLADTKAIGHEYIVVAWTPEEMRRTLDGWRHVADLYNHGAEQAKAAGLKFAYHNHSYEFVPMEGKLPYDILLDNTDPALVKLEMDLYWITAGGQDPLAYFAKYPGRIPMVHVKDMTADKHMVDVGKGVIDWRHILSHHQQAGIHHYFVEHDEPTDAFASITASYRYLSRLSV